MKSSASAANSNATSKRVVSAAAITSAVTGASWRLVRARNRGMSSDLAGMNSTSAAISVQARYAPSTDTMTPTLMNTAPQGPTIDSSTEAMDGWATPASSSCGSTP